MIALAAALLIVPQVQEEDRLKDAWPKLVEAWKSYDAFQAAPASDGGDELLKTAGKLHQAFEAAGLYGSEGEYVPLAFKTFIKSRFRGWFETGRASLTVRHGDYSWSSHTDPMKSFMDSIERLGTLEQKGLDDEDNVQDELSTARKALKAMGVTADDTPPALRRRVLALARALATGASYPEPARATDGQIRAIRDSIAGLSHESIEEREKAMRDLQKFGDAAFPFLREALKSGDAEAASRAKSLLGIGHAPWTALQATEVKTARLFRDLEALKAATDRKRADEEAERAKRR